jgi:hypothetical protein
MNEKQPTGFKGIAKWQPSFRWHHLPMWLKKALRKRAIKNGNWYKWSPHHHFLPDFFDHWGSFLSHPKAANRSVAAMPYGANMDQVLAFAKEVGCTVEYKKESPWNESTCLLIFTPETP